MQLRRPFVSGRNRGAATRYGTLLATQIWDAMVASQYIRYPQDTSLLNEARSELEKIIDFFCNSYGLEKPRTYCRIEYLSFNAFNEGPMLIDVPNAYRYRNGFYPKRVLVNKIYRTQK